MEIQNENETHFDIDMQRKSNGPDSKMTKAKRNQSKSCKEAIFISCAGLCAINIRFF